MERDELEKLMKEKLAKPDRSLYDHSLGAMRIARELLRKIPHDPGLEDCLLEHVFLHDVGKLDDRFREKLHGEEKRHHPTLTSGWSWRPASSTAPSPTGRWRWHLYSPTTRTCIRCSTAMNSMERPPS